MIARSSKVVLLFFASFALTAKTFAVDSVGVGLALQHKVNDPFKMSGLFTSMQPADGPLGCIVIEHELGMLYVVSLQTLRSSGTAHKGDANSGSAKLTLPGVAEMVRGALPDIGVQEAELLTCAPTSSKSKGATICGTRAGAPK